MVAFTGRTAAAHGSRLSISLVSLVAFIGCTMVCLLFLLVFFIVWIVLGWVAAVAFSG